MTGLHFSPGSKHTSTHAWNKIAQSDQARRNKVWIRTWRPTFANAEIGCAFCVSARWMLKHNVAKLVDDLETDLDMQFAFTVGLSYRFMRVA